MERTIKFKYYYVVGENGKYETKTYSLWEIEKGLGSEIPEHRCEFTGLKDKNGKEIYEGDIVNHGDNYPSEVIWDDDNYWLEGPGFCLRESGYKDEGYQYCYHGLPGYTSPIEVLGNIYENKELLAV